MVAHVEDGVECESKRDTSDRELGNRTGDYISRRACVCKIRRTVNGRCDRHAQSHAKATQ